MKLKTLAMLILVALISGGLTYSIAKRSSMPPNPHAGEEAGVPEPAKVEIAGLRTTVALAGEGWDTITATGRVTVPPDRLVKITPRIEGKVVAAHGTVGDAVRRGQVLAVISSVELAEARSRYRQALATLRAAESNYAREREMARVGATSARPVEEARSESLSAQGDVADAKSELAQAKSELVRQESELVQCKAKLERARELYADEIVSKQDVETADAEYKRDIASVDAAKSKVAQAEARIEKAKSRSELAAQYLAREEKLHKGRVLDMRTVHAAKAAVESARIEVRAAADRITILGADPSGSGETISVTSPISGRIIARATNVGETASPDQSLFTVANLALVWIEADIYEKDLARVRKGQPVEIRVDTYPDRSFTGKVDSVSDVLSPDSRTAKVRCVVSNSNGLLRGEMFARMSVITGKRGRAVLIPREAVLDDAGGKIVFTTCTSCPEDKKSSPSACGEYDRVEITTGPVRGDKIEVLSGIEPGTEVVTVGQHQIKTALGSGQLKAGCKDECEE